MLHRHAALARRHRQPHRRLAAPAPVDLDVRAGRRAAHLEHRVGRARIGRGRRAGRPAAPGAGGQQGQSRSPGQDAAPAPGAGGTTGATSKGRGGGRFARHRCSPAVGVRRPPGALGRQRRTAARAPTVGTAGYGGATGALRERYGGAAHRSPGTTRPRCRRSCRCSPPTRPIRSRQRRARRASPTWRSRTRRRWSAPRGRALPAPDRLARQPRSVATAWLARPLATRHRGPAAGPPPVARSQRCPRPDQKPPGWRCPPLGGGAEWSRVTRVRAGVFRACAAGYLPTGTARAEESRPSPPAAPGGVVGPPGPAPASLAGTLLASRERAPGAGGAEHPGPRQPGRPLRATAPGGQSGGRPGDAEHALIGDGDGTGGRPATARLGRQPAHRHGRARRREAPGSVPTPGGWCYATARITDGEAPTAKGASAPMSSRTVLHAPAPSGRAGGGGRLPPPGPAGPGCWRTRPALPCSERSAPPAAVGRRRASRRPGGRGRR